MAANADVRQYGIFIIDRLLWDKPVIVPLFDDTKDSHPKKVKRQGEMWAEAHGRSPLFDYFTMTMKLHLNPPLAGASTEQVSTLVAEFVRARRVQCLGAAPV